MKHLSVSERKCILNPRPRGRVDETRSTGAERASRWGGGVASSLGSSPVTASAPVFSRSAKSVCAGSTACAWGSWRRASPSSTSATSAGTLPVSPSPVSGAGRPKIWVPARGVPAAGDTATWPGRLQSASASASFKYFSLSVTVLFSMLMT